MKKGLHFLFLVFNIVLFISCNHGGSDNSQEKQVEYVGWILYNYDLNVFNYGSSAYIVFGLTLKNKDIKSSDIEYFLISGPNGYEWKFDSPKEISHLYDEENAHISSGFIDYISDKYYVLLGEYKFEIKLFNGEFINESFVTPSPGSTETNKHVAAYTEEFLQYYSHQENTIALPKRASIGDVEVNSDSITVYFTVDDPIVFNGRVYFFDAEGNNLGVSNWFVDFDTKSPCNFVNRGQGINTDGSNNRLFIEIQDISEKSEDFDFSRIKKVHFNLTDGKQYLDNRTFDCMSITEKEIK